MKEILVSALCTTYNSERYTAATFQDTLDSLVSWIVDSLNAYLQVNDIQSLYRYIFWDEPFLHHNDMAWNRFRVG